MSIYPAVLGGAIALFLGGVMIALFADGRILRLIGMAAIASVTFWFGIQFEKFEFVQRHNALCVDKTAAYFRMFNGFDPFCPQVRF